MSERGEEWTASYQNGDSEALERIYGFLKQPLYSIDIVQDTFIKLQDHKYHYDTEKGKLKSYLFQIAYRLMITKLNRRKKFQSLLPFLTPRTKDEFQHIDRITIRDAVAKLSDIERAVVLLFYYHDMPQAEIAQILDIPTGTVKSRLHRAVRQLKKELEEDFNGSWSIEKGIPSADQTE